MRAHFTICAKRPAASEQRDEEEVLEGQARTPTGAADAVRRRLSMLLLAARIFGYYPGREASFAFERSIRA
jgi:hypothetical protein